MGSVRVTVVVGVAVTVVVALFLLLRLVDDERLGRQQHGRDGPGVLNSRARLCIFSARGRSFCSR